MVAVNAASSDPSSFVSITPTRILDSRTDVGLTGPFESSIAQKLQVTGPVPTQPPGGAAPVSMEVVPTTATSVVFNVTVVSPQTKGFLSIRPGDATGVPATSNINWAADSGNIANAVTVQLPTSGMIDIYVNGTVGDVLIDVVGYHATVSAAPVLEIDSGFSDCAVNPDTIVACNFVRIAAPVDGNILVTASGFAEHLVGNGDLICSFTTGSTIEDPHMEILAKSPAVTSFGATRGFPAVGGTSYDYNLMCNESVSLVWLRNVQMTALFVAD
jgi:hypothetical protein